MNLQSKFIYKILTKIGVAFIVIAHNQADAEALVPFTVEETMKLGCVTADVMDSVDVGIISRDWADK